jgi:hypothetical protein
LIRSLLPAERLARLAGRLLGHQPDPPRRVDIGDLIDIYRPILVYGLVLAPIAAALYIWNRGRGYTPVVIVAAAVTFVVVSIGMASAIARAKAALQNGVLATGEVIDAGRLEGHIRVDIAGHQVETVYRFQRFAVGDRVGVLVDRQKQTVLLPIGITV